MTLSSTGSGDIVPHQNCDHIITGLYGSGAEVIMIAIPFVFSSCHCGTARRESPRRGEGNCEFLEPPVATFQTNK
jgi:hypothetical protein